MSLYEEALKAGLRLPMPFIVVELLNQYLLSPVQLLPDA